MFWANGGGLPAGCAALTYYMEDGALKYRIMIKILSTLIAGRKVSAREIAEKFEISPRTVYRYIDELSAAGIPVEVSRGRYGGAALMETYRLPSSFFTRDEYASACNALQAWAAQASDDAALAALDKIRQRRKSDVSEHAVTGNIIVDGGVWGDRGAFSDKLRACERAVDECACLEIDYISREGEHSRRVIDPHVLILKRNVWYVYAFCHTKQDLRTFKIGRIKRAVPTGGHFEKRNFTKDDIPLNFFHSSDDMTDVTLEIDRSALADAEEWLGIDSIEPRGNALVCEMSLSEEGLVNKILSFGGAVKVLAPQKLAQEVRDAAKIIWGEY